MHHPPLTGADRSELRAHIAHGPLRHTHVGFDNRSDLGIFYSGPETFHERQLQTFGKNIASHATKLSADVLPVRHRRRKRHQLAVVKNRQRKNQMIQVAAHGVTIVGKENVARLDVFLAPVRDLRLDRIGQAANKHRQPEPDGDRVAVAIEKSDGKIFGFVNDRVIRRAHQIGLHLSGDRHQSAANHFGGEGVDAGFSH